MTNCIRNIYYDRCGVMWVGEVRAGISLYNESIFKFNIDDLDMDRIEAETGENTRNLKYNRGG